MQKEILKICREKGFFIDKEALILLEKVDFKEFFLWFGKSGKKIINKEIVLSFPVKKNKFEVKDFRDCFTGRFERIRGFLEGRFSDLTSLRKIGEGKATIIVSVFEKHISKNKNIVLNVEDFGGQGVVIVNRFSEVFKKAENLVLDDIVAISVLSFKGRVFANDIIWPDAVLSEKKFAKDDYCIAFCSDMHVGSKNF